MDNDNKSSPATSGSQTPTVPVGSGWGQMGPGFNVPWQQLMGLLAGGKARSGQQRAGNAGVGRYDSDDAADDTTNDGDDAGMAGGIQPEVQGSPVGDTVYRPTLDFLTALSHTSTPLETQFTGDDRFSLHELGIDIG